MERIALTERQKAIAIWLRDPIYTPKFIDECLNKEITYLHENAPAALSQMGASGFYRAILAIEQALYRDCIYMSNGRCTGFNCCTEKDCPQAKYTQPWLQKESEVYINENHINHEP